MRSTAPPALGTRRTAAVLAGLLLVATVGPGCGADSGGASSDVADAGGDAVTDAMADADTDDAGVPETFAFETAALSLRVTVSPFGFTLRNTAGDIVLETVTEPLDTPADPALLAYGPPAATFNAPAYRERVHWGWDTYAGQDAPWTRFDQTHLATIDNGVLHIVLDGGGVASEVQVTIEVVDNALHVRMTLEGADAERFNRLGESFRLAADEHFFGLGGRPGRVDHRGFSYDSVVEESGLGRGEGVPPGPSNPEPNGAGMTSVPIPFVISTAGYGLWLEGDARSRFHLGSHRDDAWRLESAGQTLDYTVWVGPPQRVLTDFTAATGRPALPPEWAFGPRRRVAPDAVVGELPEWQALRTYDVPTTVIESTVPVLPDGALDDALSEVTAYTRALSQWGYAVIGYASPYLSATDPRAADAWEDAVARGVLVQNDAGDPYTVQLFGDTVSQVGLVDPTHADGPAWLAEQLQPGLDYGFAGWRLDHGEYTPYDARFADGRLGWDVRNVYPLLAQEAVRAGLVASRGDDFLLVARSGWVGTAAAATMLWLAPTNASFDEADGLPAVVRQTINLGMSGVPLVGADVGGDQSFNDPPADRELYLRWAAFAALSPAMVNGDAGIGSAEVTDRWTLWRDASTTAAYANLARWHTRLAPYRRALARQAVETGAPLVRHLALVHPSDPATWTLDDEYYLGPGLLVAPIVERGALSRQVYFPAGRFVDWRDGEVIEGPTTAIAEATIDDIPVYLADGAIVPMLDASIETLAPEDNPDVVGLADVAEWLDVRAVRSAGDSSFELADGTRLTVSVTGPVRPPFVVGEVELSPVITVGDAQTCDGCYLLREDTDPPHLWVTTPLGENVEVRGQGIRLGAAHPSTRPRRVRWDVVLLPADTTGGLR